jgi:hypothetical protein
MLDDYALPASISTKDNPAEFFPALTWSIAAPQSPSTPSTASAPASEDP